ncbi:MAG: ATP-binding cassette domain-containing protein [Alphaproteobacteria bacterium GM202ARS2]|nr:ATP-binding cassette domain-containing protein [Alphaproteobacteria bacterium GM202ARS2]
MEKIKITNLKKSFESKDVLDGVSLTIEEKESLVVIGPSGVGKSVLLKCLLGLVRPDSGSIRINGRETLGFAGIARDHGGSKVGMLFQGAALFDSMKVWENVSFQALQQGKGDKKEAYEKALENLNLVGLASGGDERVANLFPSEISGGMKKRVALARAIANRPDILYFDEPTTGLDPISSAVINKLIRECTKKIGATTLTITHDMSSVREIGDKVAMLYNGRIEWHGRVSTIDDSGNDHVHQFVRGLAEGPIQMQTDALK